MQVKTRLVCDDGPEEDGPENDGPEVRSGGSPVCEGWLASMDVFGGGAEPGSFRASSSFPRSTHRFN